MSLLHKDWRVLLKAARRQGWTVGQRRDGRVKLRSPAGQLVVLPLTPSPGKRSLQNKRAELRRAGLVLPRP